MRLTSGESKRVNFGAMIVKVCGMREAKNVAEVASLGISMMGFILYDRSPRYLDEVAPTTAEGILRVGVFVNASVSEVLEWAQFHGLHYVQLHGGESPAMCRQLRCYGLGVIKAISVATAEDLSRTRQYDGVVDYLLFDTKCSSHGGSGERFDWSILSSYRDTTPFLLSGGIDEMAADEILQINHPAFAGVDLNSRFEISPALKDCDKLKRFIEKIKTK